MITLSAGDHSLVAEDQLEPRRHRLKVLIVEDHHDAAESLQMLLCMYGYEVRVAYRGDLGLRLAISWKPDLLLCDLGLPGLDGFAIASALRSNPDTAQLRLIALSGYAQPHDIEQAREAGFDEHLGKPIDVKLLISKLKQITADRASAAAHWDLRQVGSPATLPATGIAGIPAGISADAGKVAGDPSSRRSQ